MQTSQRLKQVPASPVRKLAHFALAAKKQGVHVYHLNIGDPDILTPKVMIDVLTSWKKNPIGYAQSQGEHELIDSLLSYYRGYGYSFLSHENIQVTSGGSEAISLAMFAVANPGDEILTFEPLYTNYNSYAIINGVTLVAIATSIKDGFHLPSAKVIESRITPKTRAILYCSPNNPTGTIYTKDEIEMLVRIAKKHGLFLLSDEVYREFTYDGRKQVSLVSYMQEMADKAIVLDSLSKRYSVCGLRIGALISLNSDIMQGVLHMAQGRLSAGLVDQAVAAALTRVPTNYITRVQREYEKRRDVIYNGLRAISGVTVKKPEGAFYTIVGLPIRDAEHFCRWLLTDFRDNNETVMLAPAAGFYATPGSGKNEVRIAYVINSESLVRAVELIKIALKKYEKVQ